MRDILTSMVSMNSQNERVWLVNRAHADEKGDVKQRRKVMGWLGACSKDITPAVSFNEGTDDHAVYIFQLH